MFFSVLKLNYCGNILEMYVQNDTRKIKGGKEPKRNIKALRNKYEPNQLNNNVVTYTLEKYSKQLCKTVIKSMLVIRGNEICNS